MKREKWRDEREREREIDVVGEKSEIKEGRNREGQR